jgi:hypothetical protein
MRIMSGLFLIGALAAPVTAASAAAGNLAQCFNESDVSAWHAPDTRTIYLRVFVNRYYRIDLSRECSPLRRPDARLITHVLGTDFICSPVDFNLRASEGLGGISEPCFVKAVTQLSPAEAAALPKDAKP